MKESCPICTERSDLIRGSLLYGTPRDPAQHTILQHTQFAQIAWELGINKLDNPDEWKELKRAIRLDGGIPLR